MLFFLYHSPFLSDISAVAAAIAASVTAAAESASAAAQITQEICHAQLHTAAAVKGYGIAVHALSLLIPGTAVLKSLEQHLLLHILRIKADRFFRMLKRSHIISQP